jgi:4-amino-4-deoxy-L-arabinose transferase-like glycosyltransferase
MNDSRPRQIFAILDSRYFIPATLAAYLGLRLAAIVWVPIHQTSDELWYYNRAVALAAGQGYSESGIPTAYWPVGWPGVLGAVFWLTGPSAFVGQIVNLVCSAAIFVSTLRLGKILFGDVRVGRLGVLMLTIYPNQIAYVPALGTELFYTALLLFAVDLLVCGQQFWRSLAAGVIFGIATLTKAQTLLLPAILLVAWWALDRRRLRLSLRRGRAVAIYGAMAVVILPWTARNHHVFGEFVLVSTNGGLTLLTGNNPSAQGDYTPNDPLVREVPRGVSQQVAADHMATSLALQWVRQHPGAALALVPKKIWRLWAPDGEGEWAYQAGYPAYSDYWMIFRALRLVNQAYYVVLLGLALSSIYYWSKGVRMARSEAATGYILILYTTGISIIFSGQSRFHFPLVPWIAMYAAWTMLLATRTSRPLARAAA